MQRSINYNSILSGDLLGFLASIGIHGILALYLPLLPNAKPTLPPIEGIVKVIELTPAETNRLPPNPTPSIAPSPVFVPVPPSPQVRTLPDPIPPQPIPDNSPPTQNTPRSNSTINRPNQPAIVAEPTPPPPNFNKPSQSNSNQNKPPIFDPNRSNTSNNTRTQGTSGGGASTQPISPSTPSTTSPSTPSTTSPSTPIPTPSIDPNTTQKEANKVLEGLKKQYPNAEIKSSSYTEDIEQLGSEKKKYDDQCIKNSKEYTYIAVIQGLGNFESGKHTALDESRKKIKFEKIIPDNNEKAINDYIISQGRLKVFNEYQVYEEKGSNQEVIYQHKLINRHSCLKGG